MAQYPGYVVTAQSAQPADTRTIQTRLNAVGCGPLEVNGRFDPATDAAVRLFQSRSIDATGRALGIDGHVGPLTWFALFGESAFAPSDPPSPLAAAAFAAAHSQIGVREDPNRPNRGPEVDQYLTAAGYDPAAGSHAWCAAFAYWCYKQAAVNGVTNPLPRTGGVLDHWERAAGVGRATRVGTEQALAEPQRISQGALFVIDHGHGKGHMGVVEGCSGGLLTTIEGNTNGGGGREGDGVYRRVMARKLRDINRGFIVYR